VLITEIIRNSPAEQAGIKTGDILIAIDDQAIDDWTPC
jgi:S1-C subfamily serine protease